MDGATATLPVSEARQAIVKLVRTNRALILVGETGSGKTTQVPQFILDEIVKNDEGRMVGVTQPRRVAAISVATYVASCRQCEVGGEVGYAVRFDERCGPATRLKYMTDGILLRELLADPMLTKYSVLVLDEAHERTLHGDVLFGLLKALTAKRPDDLKIVVMSATLDTQQFSKFWRDCKVGYVSGRAFPVTVYHTDEPQHDYVDACINAVMQVHTEEAPGDVLCFLTGQEEIEDTKAALEKRLQMLPNHIPGFVLYTIYAAMAPEQQMRVFETRSDGMRKVILATNIAETSITIEGVKYVIDCGLVKTKGFDPKTGLETLHEAVVSKAQARQRTGRAGRVCAGKCFRLYTEASFDMMAEKTVPEILRSSLSSVVLQMTAMGIDDILHFEFMDKPSVASIVKAMETLYALGAVDQSMQITPQGREMAELPVDPMAARALLRGNELGVGREVCVVVAMLSTENLFVRGDESRNVDEAFGGSSESSAKLAHARSVGDQVTLLNMYSQLMACPRAHRAEWCDAACISRKQMRKVSDTAFQLWDIMNKGNDEVPPETRLQRRLRKDKSSFSFFPLLTTPDVLDGADLRRAFCSGYFLQTAYFDAKQNAYLTVVGQHRVYVHPSSVVFHQRRKAPLVLYNSVVETTKVYIRDVTAIREEWLKEASPQFFA